MLVADFKHAGFRIVLLVMFCGLVAGACPIPVYQYALEHWPADDYILEVFLPGELTAAESVAWKLLQTALPDEGRRVNLKLRRQSFSDAPAAAAGRGFMRLYYPRRARRSRSVWQGPLTPENLERLLDSPCRQRLGKALAARTSVVWILLKCGDRDKDVRAEKLVRENLDHLAKCIVIPEQADWGGQTINLDFNVNFQLLTLERNNPAEEVFLNMLLESETDLRKDFADEPLLFPVFGRGLLLYALAAGGINRWTLEKAVGFLTGACSCQVKAANPGLDLLLMLDWNSLVIPMTPSAVTGTLGPAEFLRGAQAEKENNALPQTGEEK